MYNRMSTWMTSRRWLKANNFLRVIQLPSWSAWNRIWHQLHTAADLAHWNVFCMRYLQSEAQNLCHLSPSLRFKTRGKRTQWENIQKTHQIVNNKKLYIELFSRRVPNFLLVLRNLVRPVLYFTYDLGLDRQGLFSLLVCYFIFL